jgi:hypothetical protein
MRSGTFGTSQEGVDTPSTPPGCPQLLLLSHKHVSALMCESVRELTYRLRSTASSNKEVIQQDNDCHNDEEMNESASYMEGKPTK